MPLKIYLAGPDVFFPDAIEIGAAKKAICAKYGFSGHYPLDNEVTATPGSPESGFHISRLNEALIEACDLLVANLTPFRGVSADPGTVFEVGYASALRKQVHGYSCSTQPYTARVRDREGRAGDTDGQGYFIENFGLADNLMIEGAIHHRNGLFLTQEGPNLKVFEALIGAIAARFRQTSNART